MRCVKPFCRHLYRVGSNMIQIRLALGTAACMEISRRINNMQQPDICRQHAVHAL